MMSRHEELVKREMIDELESIIGKRLPEDRRQRLIKGPSEEELVIAALEETMIRSYARVHDFWKRRQLPDFRTAAFLLAIERVAESYGHHGIFP
jgi:glutamate dehydrogenase (NAD(P)+)